MAPGPLFYLKSGLDIGKYSVILTAFYGMNQKLWTKKVYLYFQISVDFNIRLRLKVMHDYVHWHCSIDYCVKLCLVDET